MTNPYKTPKAFVQDSGKMPRPAPIQRVYTLLLTAFVCVLIPIVTEILVSAQLGWQDRNLLYWRDLLRFTFMSIGGLATVTALYALLFFPVHWRKRTAPRWYFAIGMMLLGIGMAGVWEAVPAQSWQWWWLLPVLLAGSLIIAAGYMLIRYDAQVHLPN